MTHPHPLPSGTLLPTRRMPEPGTAPMCSPPELIVFHMAFFD